MGSEERETTETGNSKTFDCQGNQKNRALTREGNRIKGVFSKVGEDVSMFQGWWERAMGRQMGISKIERG